MLYLSVVISLILLVIANSLVLTSKRPLTAIPVAIPVALLFACNGHLVLHGVFLQALLLVVASICCSNRRRRPKFFLAISVAGTALIYVSLGWFAHRDLVHLQRQNAYVSMEERLPAPKLQLNTVPTTAAAQKRLEYFEERMEMELLENRHFVSSLKSDLERLHEETLETFVNSPGFGASRAGALREYYLRNKPKTKPVPQNYVRLSAEWDYGAMHDPLTKKPNADLGANLQFLHQSSILNFVNVKGFGFFKDRRHVAGFASHGFSEDPDSDLLSKLQMVELIGLVMHEEPVVYISENLPRMDELRKAPTRSLDQFESLGLKSLRRGDDIFVRDMAAGRRMLGAIRAARQCVNCHGGNRGALLGAFSYTMTK